MEVFSVLIEPDISTNDKAKRLKFKYFINKLFS